MLKTKSGNWSGIYPIKRTIPENVSLVALVKCTKKIYLIISNAWHIRAKMVLHRCRTLRMQNCVTNVPLVNILTEHCVKIVRLAGQHRRMDL